MISPIQPLEMGKLRSQNTPNKDINTKIKKEEKPKFNIEWYCGCCERRFKVPKKNNSKGIERFCCPYCSSSQLTNNYQDKGGTVWEV